jgi:hypothetical protein
VVRCEQRESSAALLAQATKLEDRLGLSPQALRYLLWTVEPSPDAEVRPLARGSVRRRIRAVDDGGDR